MKLNEMIVTTEDLANWNVKLMEQSKEVLVELLVDKMTKDYKFSSEIYFKLVSVGESIERTIQNFETAVDNELDNRYVNVEQILTLSEIVINIAKDDLDLYVQLKCLVTVIISLNNAIDQGAGMETDNDFLIVEKMNEAFSIMLNSVEQKCNDLSVDKFRKIYSFLEEKSNEYSSIDGEDRIGCVFEKFIEQTRGFIRLDEARGYIRGAEYYRNLNHRK